MKIFWLLFFLPVFAVAQSWPSSALNVTAVGGAGSGAVFAAPINRMILEMIALEANPPTPYIGSFTASPALISSGSSSTLSWVTKAATTLSINNSIGTVTGSSRNVTPSVTTTYVITATSTYGTATASVTVAVQ